MFDYKNKENNKTERIVIRVSKSEKEFIEKYCKDRNISVSKYIYNLICIDLTMFKK